MQIFLLVLLIMMKPNIHLHPRMLFIKEFLCKQVLDLFCLSA